MPLKWIGRLEGAGSEVRLMEGATYLRSALPADLATLTMPFMPMS